MLYIPPNSAPVLTLPTASFSFSNLRCLHRNHRRCTVSPSSCRASRWSCAPVQHLHASVTLARKCRVTRLRRHDFSRSTMHVKGSRALVDPLLPKICQLNSPIHPDCNASSVKRRHYSNGATIQPTNATETG